MVRQLDHVLLTRFNLPTIGVESVVRAHEGWLKDRVELFERYCAPSVAAQTNPNLRWIVYLDPDSPSWLLQRIDRLARDVAFLHPVLRAHVPREALMHDLRSIIEEPAQTLITTNLDNDDALAVDFVDRLQGVTADKPRIAVYVRTGLVKGPGVLFLRTDPHNAFCSVVERWEDAVTCWSDWHNLLPRQMPAIGLRGAPGWLQVIHGGNVSNRIRGRRVSSTPYQALFPGLLTDVVEPTRGELLTDRLLLRPGRGVSETGRLAVKKTLMALVGKQGFDEMKRALLPGFHRRRDSRS